MSTDAYLFVDAGRVRFDITRFLEANPELADDAELRADMLEGETEIDAFLTRAFLAMRLRQERAAGTKTIMADLKARHDREVAAADKIKAMMLTVMETADLDKRVLPVATLTVSSGRKSVEVYDVNELPQGAYTLERKKVSGAEIEAMIAALPKGETFPGARLVLGPDYLTVRAR